MTAPRESTEAVERALAELAQVLSSRELPPEAHQALEALKTAWQQVQQGAQTDALTQLPNRAHFEHALACALERVASTASVALMFLDLDGFKNVNDQFGHRAGDLLLKAVAKRVVASVRDGDLVARYGGDEFVVLLQGPATAELAPTLAQRIVENVSTAYSLDGAKFELSISIGVAVYPTHAKDAAELVERADASMYRAKRRGGHQYAVYDESLAREHQSGIMRLDTNESADREPENFNPRGHR